MLLFLLSNNVRQIIIKRSINKIANREDGKDVYYFSNTSGEKFGCFGFIAVKKVI